MLADIINKYNNTYHRYAPRKVSNHQHVYEALFGGGGEAVDVNHIKFKIGDHVRIIRKKETFEKGFTPNWTEEVFTVDNIKSTQPVTYSLVDAKGEKIQGTFYEQELQKTEQQIYHIEKVLKKRMRSGVQEVYVKWKGYNNSFNSWFPLADLKDGS